MRCLAGRKIRLGGIAWALLAAPMWLGAFRASGAAPSRQDFLKLKKEIAEIRQVLDARRPVGEGPVGRAEAILGRKFGPNRTATTRSGKLRIGGLIQVWFYSIQNDSKRVFDGDPLLGLGLPGQTATQSFIGSNEVNDNDSFRIRRAELRFTMDIHENVSAHVMLDPAREATSFPGLPQNQSDVISGDGAAAFNAGLLGTPLIAPIPTAVGNRRNALVRNGSGSANRLLQDAYLNYHGLIPHHDVTVGQFRRRLGEEGSRDSAKLDFVERAMITQLGDLRDLGVQLHGAWWKNGRVQYWLGLFDGAGSAFQQRQNRANMNDDMDLVGTLLVRPLWRDERWGSLELGYSILYGKGGESGGRAGGTDGLNRNRTVHSIQYAWGLYKPGGPVSGWWIRGEWGQYRDRFAPLELATSTLSQTTPAPFNIQGWYVATGYKLSESIWGAGLREGHTWRRRVLEPMEFTFRYDVMENIFTTDLVNPTRRQDVFKTQVWTAGINYEIKEYHAKLQVNFNWVIEDNDNDQGLRQLREVRNNNLVVNFQVAW